MIDAAPAPDLAADEPADLPTGVQGYVAGFLLDGADRVVLVRKRRPSWQAGLLNGVGGKIEPGETPAAAMRREFREEAGLDLAGWEPFLRLHFTGGVVWFFRLRAAAGLLEAAEPCTDEPIEVHPIAPLLAPDAPTIPNLRWVFPLAAHGCDAYGPIVVHHR